MRDNRNSKDTEGRPGLIQAALFGVCPQCGARTLFDGPAQIAVTCRACGLDLGTLERWGRLAGLVTIVLTAALIGAAIAFDIFVRPAMWVHVVVWMPVTIGTVLFGLRFYKTLGVYAAFANRPKTDEQSDLL